MKISVQKPHTYTSTYIYVEDERGSALISVTNHSHKKY